MAYGPPHRNPGADAYLRRGLLIHLRAGRRGQRREDIQRRSPRPRNLQLRRILHPTPPERGFCVSSKSDEHGSRWVGVRAQERAYSWPGQPE